MTKNKRTEKAGNIQRQRKIRRTRPSSLSTCSLPLELTSEILLKLPAKSVVRFGCVSKQWLSITTNPYFTNSFENRSPTRPSLILCCKQGAKLFMFSILNGSCEPFDRYDMKLPKEHKYFSPTESVHGLICFQTSKHLMLWNPSMRTVSTIPKPRTDWNQKRVIRDWNLLRVILGYDPVEGKHKVVCFPRYRYHDECWVLTLGSAKKTIWRTVKINHKHRLCRYGRCINGIVYYKSRNQSGDRIVMSFDVRTEKFDMIKLPLEYNAGILINYEGKLASVGTTRRGGIRMWILEDAEKREWSYKYFSALKKHGDKKLRLRVRLKGCTDAGEFIYVPTKRSKPLKSSYVLYFDWKRKSFRKVEFKGIKDRKFMELHTILGKMSISDLHVIPNHNDTMMSY